MPRHPKVFMEFTVGSKNVGRVVFELFSDITPRTAENFRGLCTGEYGAKTVTSKQGTGSRKAKLHYLGSKIHRIVEGFVI